MFDDYLKAILDACEKKKDEETFPLFLSHPTPGNFRKECITVYRERYLSSDDEILRSFFGATDKEKGYSKIIDNSKADEFRQMPKILREELNNPGLKYIELLAWLIDFGPRPNTLFYKQASNNKTTNNPDILGPAKEEPGGQNFGTLQGTDQKTAEQNPGALQDTDHDANEISGQETGELRVIDHHTDETTEQNPGAPEVMDHDADEAGEQKNDLGSPAENEENNNTGTEPAKPINKVVIASIVLFLVAGTTFFFWKKKQDIAPNTLFTVQKCMYWTGDRYEPVDCNEKSSNVSIIPLDTQKLNRLQKITSPDTLTANALGKVWYTKIAGEHQFFTDSGVHPLDTQKKLKPVTRYILSNHVSYYRYLLTLVIWSICVVIFIGLCSIFLIAFRKKRKRKTLALTSPKMLA